MLTFIKFSSFTFSSYHLKAVGVQKVQNALLTISTTATILNAAEYNPISSKVDHCLIASLSIEFKNQTITDAGIKGNPNLNILFIKALFSLNLVNQYSLVKKHSTIHIKTNDTKPAFIIPLKLLSIYKR